MELQSPLDAMIRSNKHRVLRFYRAAVEDSGSTLLNNPLTSNQE